MKGTSSQGSQFWRTVSIFTVGTVCFCAVLFGQKNSIQPQPQADKLAPVSVPSRGQTGRGQQPEGVMPTVPAGFTVSVYAELPSPRMMVYAPNGDLFVSSPASNTITVLRDANNDGVFEERGVYATGGGGGGARGGAPGGGRGGAGGPGGGGRGAGPGAAPGGPAPGGPAPAGAGQGGGAGRGAGGPGGFGGGAGAGGGQGRGPGGPGGGAPATPVAPGTPNPAQNGPVLGAAAPACTPPPAFVQPGPGTLAAPFGMAFNNGYLYVANTGSLIRYKYTSGDMAAQGEPEKLMDLPTGGHSTRNVIFNTAGTKMYLAVGSQSNNNAGEDCRRAAVLEFNPDGSGYRVFASGIRNPVGLTLQPGTDTVWVAINERDNLGDDLVPDYATSVKDGGFYGWPYSYIGKNYDPRYVGAFPELVNRAIVPDVLIPAHSAALGIGFYTGTQFPQRYRNGAFVALHGSWNRQVAAGYKVAFFPMTNGKPGPLEDFMTGFLSSDGSNGTQIVPWGRPVGVTVARDGSLLISDDGGNRIWKVSAAAAPRGAAR